MIYRTDPTTSSKTQTTSSVDASASYRVIATELHGTGDDYDGDELPAHRAVSEQLPGLPGLHALDLGPFLQDLVELAGLDLTAAQPSQG